MTSCPLDASGHRRNPPGSAFLDTVGMLDFNWYRHARNEILELLAVIIETLLRLGS